MAMDSMTVTPLLRYRGNAQLPGLLEPLQVHERRKR
jgi:hypothetical protein